MDGKLECHVGCRIKKSTKKWLERKARKLPGTLKGNVSEAHRKVLEAAEQRDANKRKRQRSKK